MWVPETFGTVAYIFSHRDLPTRLVAGINLDMVGENQETCKSTLTLDRTPDSLPSYLNDLLQTIIEESITEFDIETRFGPSSTFRHTTIAHTGGSDHHEFSDPTIGIPCIMLLQWPDMYYHTSMDTIDKVSTNSLKRVGWIATLATLMLANADIEEAVLLTSQTCLRGLARIEETQRQAAQALYEKKNEPRTKTNKKELAKALAKTASFYRSKIEHILWREKKAVDSVKKLTNSPELDNLIQKCIKDIDAAGKQALTRIEENLSFTVEKLGVSFPVQIELTEAEKRARTIIPKRLFKGTLAAETFRQLLGGDEYRWYEEMDEKDVQFERKRAEIINFMDGKRTLHDIVKTVSAEYGTETSIEHALKFIRDLEKTKLIMV